MTPLKVWTLAKGDFDLPPDEEFDAKQMSVPPPVGAGWPFGSVYFIDYHADGREDHRYCVRASDGKWLEIVDAD